MNKIVYVVIINDRHTDTTVEVFKSRASAIGRARALAKEYSKHNDSPVEEETIEGWEYYARYSVEADSVRVVKAELK